MNEFVASKARFLDAALEAKVPSSEPLPFNPSSVTSEYAVAGTACAESALSLRELSRVATTALTLIYLAYAGRILINIVLTQKSSGIGVDE